MKATKESMADIRQAVEQAVTDTCQLSNRGLWFCVNEVHLVGDPLSRIDVSATLHFRVSGSPFCCGEPGCHLGLFKERLDEVSGRVRKTLNLHKHVSVAFDDRIEVNYHDGVVFTYSP